MQQQRPWSLSSSPEPLSPQAMRALTLSALEGGQSSSRRDDPYAVAFALSVLKASVPPSAASPANEARPFLSRSLPPAYAMSEGWGTDRASRRLSPRPGSPGYPAFPPPSPKANMGRTWVNPMAVDDWTSGDGLPASSRRSSSSATFSTSSRQLLPPRPVTEDLQPPRARRPREKSLLMQQQKQEKPPPLKNAPGDAMRKLPKEILDVMVEELRRVHLEGPSAKTTCSTCWMRDVCSLSLTNRQWAASARPQLYHTIILVGSDSTNHMKKFKLKWGARLKLLRRTLRANTVLAGYVRVLKVPNIVALMSKKDMEIYLDLVASVVVACPNLEKLLDFHIPYKPGYSRLAYAISTRRKLTEYVWNFAAQNVQASEEEPDAFASRHTLLSYLKTLVLHCSEDGTFDSNTVIPTLQKLPALEHLALSALPSLPPNILSSLPPLKSLYIAANSSESCPYDAPFMITPALSTFIVNPSSASLRSLSLINTDLESLPVLARLLKSLGCLERLTFHQDNSPSLPIGVTIAVYPYLTSSSIKYLHWDIFTPNETHRSADATRILARSIRADGFPALRRLRAPCDYDGLLQCVCRPTPRIYMPHHYVTARRRLKSYGSSKDSGIGLTPAEESLVAVTAHIEGDKVESRTRSLLAARKAAQTRIDLARLRPRFSIVCEDWQDSGQAINRDTYDIAGFVGMVGSLVTYDLDPDIEDDDEALMTVEGLVRGTEATATESCAGSWNRSIDASRHEGRHKWRSVGVEKLFA